MKEMDPIRVKMTAAALGAVAVAALVLASGRGDAPILETGDPALVDRVVAALDAPQPPKTPLGRTGTRAALAPAAPSPSFDETAAAIAAATRLALAEISTAPVAPAVAATRPQPAPSAFRVVAETEPPAFVISAADAAIAADQGWTAASGVAPAEPGPRPRPIRP